MLEKRNVVRRNLTGGLALGAGAGMLLALPDAVSSIFMPDVSFSAWAGMVLLFFFDGIVTGGFLGLARGMFQVLVDKFSEDHTQAMAWSRWGRRALAAGWAGSIFPSLPFGMMDRFLFVFVFAAISAAVLPAVHDFCVQAARRRERLPRLAACMGLFLAAGWASTSSAWGGPRWFWAPGFWFMTGFFLHVGVLHLGVMAVRAHSRNRGRVFSWFASPLTVGALLLAAMLGGSIARRMLADAEPELRRASRLVYGLIADSERTGNARPADLANGEKELPAETRPVQVPEMSLRFPWKQPVTASAWRIDETRSLLVVTTEDGENPRWKTGACYTGGWRTGGGLDMDVGSLFTGHHLPMWVLTAPERPAPGPSWPWIFSRTKRDVVRHGSLEPKNPEYFREIPGFGFPEPFVAEGVSPLDAFLRTRDLLEKPFFGWVHQSRVPAAAANALQDAAQKDGFVVLWLTLRTDETVDACIFDPLDPRPWTQEPAAFSMAGILPSLMPAPGHRTEFPGGGFPDRHHPRVRVRGGVLEEARRMDARRLQTRIRKMADGAFPRELSAWVDFLDSRICRGRMASSEIRRVFARAQAFQERPEIALRLDLLRWRLGFPDTPPFWVVQRAWVLRLSKLGILPPPSGEDPVMTAWISALQDGFVDRIQKYCPGYSYASSMLQKKDNMQKGN